ncbi:MAG: 16S rRNA (guanine(966)-N(2))-methyltransferase RsmD [Lachnospiraceae bacterium]|nr:16S rRNA (guanine(966)-N(2))-methyltransferase RsmD [Lachnospiraceae bacterium]
MRVIAGTARRLILKTPSGDNTRPTSDKIKETLFNILQFDIPEATFLDVFSGSGGIGIEALSRGAKKAVFVERDREALKCINYNISHTHFEDKAKVYSMDALRAVKELKRTDETFDIVFMDPPYKSGSEFQVLAELHDSSLINEDSMIIVEAAYETELTGYEELGYKVNKVKNYKTNKHIFLKKV